MEAEGVEGSAEAGRRNGMKEEDAGGGVMGEESASSPCGRTFGTEDVREDGTEEGGDVEGGGVG